MQILSPAFENNETIPVRFTCDGTGISPRLEIAEVPENAKSLALVIEDPDAPNGTFIHWMVWNIVPETTEIEEGTIPEGATGGMNSSGSSGYVPPCPPSGIHHYQFKLYALDTLLELTPDSNIEDLTKMMNAHILDRAELIGLYGRK